MTNVSRLFATLFIAALTCICAVPAAFADELSAAESFTAWSNEYYGHSSPVKNHLVARSDGGMQRVEYLGNMWLVVEDYNSNYELQGQRFIDASTFKPSDLASDDSFCWGGFYEGNSNYFVITGQNNDSESNSLAVVRVTKYSKDWAYEGNCEFSGINTYIPFDAGSLDCAELNGVLYVRTCHEMYMSSDGLHHQANMTLLVNESDMTRAGGEWQVGNIYTSYGYVSHSFNQFITTYNDILYAVDHGDAYPRAVSLKELDGRSTLLLKIAGETGINATHATVGGLEASESAGTLLTVGSSVDQSVDFDTASNYAKNAWIAVTDESDLSTKFIWLSNYANDSTTEASNPQIVKINDDKFLVMWGVVTDKNAYGSNSISYVFVDGQGNKLSSTVTRSGVMSDCQPVVANGKVTWYSTGQQVDTEWGYTAWTDSAPIFYTIGINDNLSTRIAGNEAADTAALIASEAFEASDWAILARDDDFADSMSATGLAGALQAPIILTNREGLSDVAREELQRLGVKNVYIIGGTGAMPGDFEQQLLAAGVTGTIERVYGTEYYDTSVRCAEKIVAHGGDTTRAIVAYGQNFQDALSISAFAYAYKVPIFLQTPGETSSGRELSEGAYNLLSSGAYRNACIYIPGGPGAVSYDSVENIFGSTLRGGWRIWGDTGYDTSDELAKHLVANKILSASTVCIATGAEAANGLDALAGAALAGKNGGVMLLVSAQNAMEAENYATINGFLTRHHASVTSTYLLGGTYVLPDAFKIRVDSLLAE